VIAEAVQLTPDVVDSTTTIGLPTLVAAQVVTMVRVPAGSTVSDPTVSVATPATVTPEPITTTATVGLPSLRLNQQLEPATIPSGEVVRRPTIGADRTNARPRAGTPTRGGNAVTGAPGTHTGPAAGRPVRSTSSGLSPGVPVPV
jgi:hypothetical protein